MTDAATREARREELLSAATTAFARRGYFGTTTNEVATEASISQPYVVQYFGSKESLFLQVHERAGTLVTEQMRSVAAASASMPTFVADYKRIVVEPTLLLVIMHAVFAASVPAIGDRARELFVRMYDILVNEAHATPEQAHEFLGKSLLLNTVLAMDIENHLDENPWVKPLLDLINNNSE
ncbi:MAG TPA: TetR/AcrR family transcriptional regulator [Terrimesophilobacter sp.]|nr:TetR/AcrR family transcriptional regulator [Terrimesophilobacter sp.]HRQ00009.1 TetR/AcrR family transcriptional regulator [Terrimesophilobacter sp.]